MLRLYARAACVIHMWHADRLTRLPTTETCVLAPVAFRKPLPPQDAVFSRHEPE